MPSTTENDASEMPDWDNLPVDPFYDPDGLNNPDTKIGLKNGFFISANEVDLFKDTLQVADTLVLWPRPGESTLKTAWCGFFETWNRENVHKLDQSNMAWTPCVLPDAMTIWDAPEDVVLQITIPNARLRHVYVVANPAQAWASEAQVRRSMDTVLSTLVQLPVRDVCFNPMEGGAPAAGQAHAETVRNARAMVDVLDGWRQRCALGQMQSAYLIECNTRVFVTQPTTQRWR